MPMYLYLPFDVRERLHELGVDDFRRFDNDGTVEFRWRKGDVTYSRYVGYRDQLRIDEPSLLRLVFDELEHKLHGCVVGGIDVSALPPEPGEADS